jgi:glutamyl-tRNA synthetase
MVRYAVSTLGKFDLNDLRLLLLSQVVSLQKNLPLVIRVEDINENKDESKEKTIMEMLNLFSIHYSHVLQQKNNFKYHQQIAMQFLVDKKAFNCFCSDETLENEKEIAKEQNEPYFYNDFCQTLHDETVLNTDAPFRVRLKKPTKNYSYTDVVYGETIQTPNEIDSVIILNQNKTPTPCFANSVDDMLSNITFVLEDSQNLKTTNKEIYIRDELGYTQEIQYAHIQSIENNNSTTIQSLIKDGYLPVAITNYLISLGLETPQEIFTIEEALAWYDISKLSKETIQFNLEDLQNFNQKHIKEFDNLRLSKILGYADDDIGKLAKVFANKLFTTNNIKNAIDKIFAKKEEPKQYTQQYNQIKEFLSDAPFIEDYDELKSYIVMQLGFKGDELNKPLKYLILGDNQDIDMDEAYPYIKNYLGEIIC